MFQFQPALCLKRWQTDDEFGLRRQSEAPTPLLYMGVVEESHAAGSSKAPSSLRFAGAVQMAITLIHSLR
jgi:hypothetical protein